MFGDISDSLVPMMIFAIPIVAIIGGITAGIVKTISEGRIVENAQKERIAAIQAGIDPTKLPPLPGRPTLELETTAASVAMAGHAATFDYVARRRAWGLLVGGLVCTFVGVGLAAFLYYVGGEEGNAWAVGLIPGSVGLALLLSWLIVRPKDGVK
jgi:hypothetical protein